MIAVTMADGLIGWLARWTPSGASASLIALASAGGEAIAPPSPMPLAPPGSRDAVSTCPYSMTGASAAVGSR